MSSLAGLVLQCEPGPGRLETWISDGFGRSRNLLKDVEICEHRKQDRHVMSCHVVTMSTGPDRSRCSTGSLPLNKVELELGYSFD